MFYSALGMIVLSVDCMGILILRYIMYCTLQ